MLNLYDKKKGGKQYMEKIVITGAGGFVGTKLSKMFTQKGYEVVAVKRGQLKDIEALSQMVSQAAAVINLAGANIIQRWSDEYKKVLYNSRIDTTKALVEAMQRSTSKPRLFISTSAIGIYKNEKEYNELDFEYSSGFLGKLCQDWEKEALKANELGIRTCIFRFGIILGHGGALSRMMPAFKLGIAGTIGDGSQPFSFIHIDDLIDAYTFVMENENLEGVFNLTAPNPTTNKGLTKTLGRFLNRPTLIPLPIFVLKLIFGEGAQVLTQGQTAVPKRLLDEGFKFKFESIEQTIKDLV